MIGNPLFAFKQEEMKHVVDLVRAGRLGKSQVSPTECSFCGDDLASKEIFGHSINVHIVCGECSTFLDEHFKRTNVCPYIGCGDENFE